MDGILFCIECDRDVRKVCKECDLCSFCCDCTYKAEQHPNVYSDYVSEVIDSLDPDENILE